MPNTSFKPQTHGFAFGNSWTLDETESDEIRRVVTSGVNVALLTLGRLEEGVVAPFDFAQGGPGRCGTWPTGTQPPASSPQPPASGCQR